jgi:aminoglycoside phosphotransferase (APT) family kinase protein
MSRWLRFGSDPGILRRAHEDDYYVSHPSAEIHVGITTVRLLLERECPEFVEQPIHLVGEGWDNYTFRIGEQHAVRLPRRDAAVALLRNEQRWLPVLGPRLPLLVPVPVHSGQPGELFGWPWSVVKWIRGRTAEEYGFEVADAVLLAQTLGALHEPAPENAPANPYRGVPLDTKAEAVEGWLDRLRGMPGVDGSRLRVLWREACSASMARERRWLHGDLHPFNVLVRDGSLVALIDWGDISGGDVATDIACAWTLIDSRKVRREFLDAYGASEALVHRAMGWAINLGLFLVASGEPRHVPLGLATLKRVVAGT